MSNYTKEQLDFIYENAKLNKESGYWEVRGSDELELLFELHEDMTAGDNEGWGMWYGSVWATIYRLRNVPPQEKAIFLSIEKAPEEGQVILAADFGYNSWRGLSDGERDDYLEYDFWTYAPPIPTRDHFTDSYKESLEAEIKKLEEKLAEMRERL